MNEPVHLRVIGGFNTRSSFYKWFVKAECISSDAKGNGEINRECTCDLQIVFAMSFYYIDELSIDVELIKLCNLHPRADILKLQASCRYCTY